MNCSKLGDEICRICLEDQSSLSWNDEISKFCGVSYKDCYYKYTQIEETDADTYPTNLCGKCASQVKNAHNLFEKALKSFIILQNSAKGNGFKPISSSSSGSQTIMYQSLSFAENNIESFQDENVDLEIDEVICYSPIQDDVEDREKAMYACKEFSGSHESNRSPVEKKTMESFDINLLKNFFDKKDDNKRKILRSLNSALQINLRLEVSGSKLRESTSKTLKSLPVISLKGDQKKVLISVVDTKSEVRGKKTQYSGQTLPTNILQDNTEQVPLSKSQEKTEQKNGKKCSLTYLNFEKSNTNSSETLSSNCATQRKLPKSFASNASERKDKNKLSEKNYMKGNIVENDTSSAASTNEINCISQALMKTLKPSEISLLEQIYGKYSDTKSPSKTGKRQSSEFAEKIDVISNASDCNYLEQNNSEDDLSSEVPSNVMSYISKESQSLSLSEQTVVTKKDTFKPSEISLLEQIYGKHSDIESLTEPSTQKSSQGTVKMCQYCSLQMMGTHRLLAHEATHIEDRARKMICPRCGLRLYTKVSLREHMKTHIENRQKQHLCEFCEKAFFHRGALNVHRRIHLGLMIKCQMCPREFYRKVDLQKHIPSHSAAPLQYNGTEKKKYTVECQYCNKSIQTTRWKAHKAAHLKEPQVKCKVCNKDFYSRTSCVDHLHGVHRKKAEEYEENIHYYVDCTRRMSHLMIKQQEIVLPVLK